MNLQLWFLKRFIATAVACAVAYYLIAYNVLFKVPSQLTLHYTILSCSVILALAFAVTKYQLNMLPEEEEAKANVRSEAEFSWDKLATNPRNPHNLGSPLEDIEQLKPIDTSPIIRELETKQLKSNEAEKLSFDELLEKKIMQGIADANVKIENFKVTRGPRGKRFRVVECTIKMESQEKPKPTPQQTEAFKVVSRRRKPIASS